MNVFISWSGDRSRLVAEALRDWLPDIIQSVHTWTSSRDITAGARWNPEISEQLSTTKFGVLCLTQENQEEPWILFEAGALAKTLRDAFVVPYLVDLDPSDLEGPLAQFQAQRRDKDGTWELVRSMNLAVGKVALPEERLRRVFNRSWPELEEAVNRLPELKAPPKARRPDSEILREILGLVRGISKRSVDLPTRQELGGPRISRSRSSSGRSRDARTFYAEPSERFAEMTIADAELEAAREAALEEAAVEESMREEAMREEAISEDAVQEDLQRQEAAQEEAEYQAQLAAEAAEDARAGAAVDDAEVNSPEADDQDVTR